MKQFKINPGDLAFTFGKCRRCYWNKVHNGIVQPSRPIPNVLLNMNKMIIDSLEGRNLRDTLGKEFPDGIVVYANQKALSGPIKDAKETMELTIHGVFPLAFKKEDGSFGLALVKTSEVLEEYVPFYWLQLQAYVFALEHAAQDGLDLKPISEIGIIEYEPNTFDIENGKMSGNFKWLDLDLDRNEFQIVLAEIIRILKAPSPEPEEDCEWCQYAKKNNIGNLVAV